jgi:hypothetical protein
VDLNVDQSRRFVVRSNAGSWPCTKHGTMESVERCQNHFSCDPKRYRPYLGHTIRHASGFEQRDGNTRVRMSMRSPIGLPALWRGGRGPCARAVSCTLIFGSASTNRLSTEREWTEVDKSPRMISRTALTRWSRCVLSPLRGFTVHPSQSTAPR